MFAPGREVGLGREVAFFQRILVEVEEEFAAGLAHPDVLVARIDQRVIAVDVAVHAAMLAVQVAAPVGVLAAH